MEDLESKSSGVPPDLAMPCPSPLCPPWPANIPCTYALPICSAHMPCSYALPICPAHSLLCPCPAHTLAPCPYPDLSMPCTCPLRESLGPSAITRPHGFRPVPLLCSAFARSVLGPTQNRLYPVPVAS